MVVGWLRLVGLIKVVKVMVRLGEVCSCLLVKVKVGCSWSGLVYFGSSMMTKTPLRSSMMVGMYQLDLVCNDSES